MQEVMVKTHLIITDIHEEYHMNWCGKLLDAKPIFNEKGMPIFAIIGSENRMNVSTLDMNYLEECAKRLTHPRGRSAISSDVADNAISHGNIVLSYAAACFTSGCICVKNVTSRSSFAVVLSNVTFNNGALDFKYAFHNFKALFVFTTSTV